jgi:hypothetical protein
MDREIGGGLAQMAISATSVIDSEAIVVDFGAFPPPVRERIAVRVNEKVQSLDRQGSCRRRSSRAASAAGHERSAAPPAACQLRRDREVLSGKRCRPFCLERTVETVKPLDPFGRCHEAPARSMVSAEAASRTSAAARR